MIHSNNKYFHMRLKGTPPEWAMGVHSGDVWYFENELSEQWVAIIDENNKLRVAGFDIGWNEMILDKHTAILEKERLQLELREPKQFEWKICDKDKYPLSEWIYGEGEIYWLLSVLTTSITVMKFREAS